MAQNLNQMYVDSQIRQIAIDTGNPKVVEGYQKTYKDTPGDAEAKQNAADAYYKAYTDAPGDNSETKLKAADAYIKAYNETQGDAAAKESAGAEASKAITPEAPVSDPVQSAAENTDSDFAQPPPTVDSSTNDSGDSSL